MPILTCGAALITLMSGECRADEHAKPEGLVQYGSMHETIGEQNHEARVSIADIVKRPHFYAVGAVAGLRGEITILDSKPIVTAVNQDKKPDTNFNPEVEATLLIGESVSAWTEVSVEEDVAPGKMDAVIDRIASAKGIDLSRPFMFLIKGEFTSARLHIINGACPLRARMKKEKIADEKQPFEFEAKHVKGTVVGVFAVDSVGKLTHPATKQHAHLVYVDESIGERVTGHLEQYGVKKGAVLMLPSISEPDAAPVPTASN